MVRKFSATSYLLLLSSSLPVTTAIAQPEGEEGTGALQEVIVTASRREESSQRAALAIQPITADELSRAGVTQPEDLNALAPGVAIGTGGNYPQVYIRGVGNFATNAFAEGAVAMNMDGVYISRAWAVRGSFFDLGRVEVLKGPQGTLYGRNASGGAINLISARPTQNLGGYFEAEAGDYDLWRGTGAVNIPITPELAIRAAGQIIRRDGYMSDGYSDERSESARVHALWNPTADLSVLLTGGYQSVGGMGEGATLSPALPGDRWRGVSDPATAQIYLSDPLTGLALAPVLPDQSGMLDLKVYTATAEVNWETAAGTFTFLPAYRDSKYAEVNFVPGFYTSNHEHNRQTSVEARLARENEWLKFVAGAYYFDEQQSQDDGQPELLVLQGVSAQAVTPFENQTRSYAGFGQATVSIAPELRFTGGLRYTYENKQPDGRSTVYSFPNQTTGQCDSPAATFSLVTPSPPLFCGINFPLVGDLTYKSWTYKAGAEYDLAPQSLLYANVSTGFKSGGFIIGPPPNNTFKPEKLRSYEFGSKNRFLDNRLQFNVEAYYWEYRDHQESHVGPTSIPGLFTFITENAGRATLYGVDMDTTLMITHDDRLDVKVAYEHSEYDSFSYSNATAAFGPPVTGCAVGPLVNGAQEVDCSGKQVVRAPDWSGTVGYEHTFQLGGAGELAAGVQTQFASSSYLSIDFLPDLKQDSYALVDFNLRYLEPGARWSVSAYVHNIEDKAVYTQGFRFPFITPLNPIRPDGVNWVTVRAPRTFGAQFRYDF